MTTLSNGAPGAWTTDLSTGLNGLANGSSAVSAAISPDGALSMDVAVNLASLTPANAMSLQLHILCETDGTNYEDIVSMNPATLAGTIVLAGGAGVKRAEIKGIPQPARGYKIGLLNNAGVALAASGNTVAHSTYTQTAA